MLDINYITPDAEKISLDGLQALGLINPANPDSARNAVKNMIIYADFLIQKNQVMNLTAITDPAEIMRLHFLDSCAPASLYDFHDKSVIDIGSGAGFPGLPLKIIIPSIRLTLLDAQRKRVDFLQSVCEKLNLPGDIQCVHGRAEELIKNINCRESFDIAISRAVASLPVLIELSLPFVKLNGCFIAMKSIQSDQELSDAANAIQILGGQIERVQDYQIPGADIYHRLIIIRKVKNTPPRYPRAFARIKKSPL